MIHTGKNLTGNARFYGFCIDVLERISKIIGFNYILDLVQDKKVSVNTFPSNEWALDTNKLHFVLRSTERKMPQRETGTVRKNEFRLFSFQFLFFSYGNFHT